MDVFNSMVTTPALFAAGKFAPEPGIDILGMGLPAEVEKVFTVLISVLIGKVLIDCT
jgi:hypothetical protein